MLYKSVLFVLATAFGAAYSTEAPVPFNSTSMKFVDYGKVMETCAQPGDHTFCCEAPQHDPKNCPASARTPDCDAQGACCCA
mmetsp:Transcript_25260/g.42620  ORF Transcript_25260/g.42620 Transcript_25260/m.42620 type:complete len:82 (+) Transcript_25260:56-301(+)